MVTGPGHTAFRVPIEFLNWPQRMKGEDGQGKRSIIAPPDKVWRAHFANWLLHLDPSQHLETLEETTTQFFKTYNQYIHWWRAVFKEADIRPQLFDGEPRIPLDRLTSWRFAMSRLDPDALLTLAIHDQAPNAPHGPVGLLEELDGWRVFPAVDYPDLSVLVARGVADTHVHLEASDPIPVLWSRLVIQDVALDHVPRYSIKELNGIRDNSERWTKRLEERRFIEGALAWRRSVVGQERNVFRTMAIPSLEQRSLSGLALLQAERIFLLACWRHLDDPRGKAKESFVAAFDRYLYAKSHFLREQTQFPNHGSGLQRFRDFLQRGEPLSEKRGANRSVTFMRARLTRQATLALECPHLRRLELRISPRKTLREWARFFKIWEQAYPALNRHDEDVRFIVHFIRDIKHRKDQPHFWALRRKMDRLSAQLHLFRHEDQREGAVSRVFDEQRRHETNGDGAHFRSGPNDGQRPTRTAPLARWIVGLDVANLERGCPPSVMIPFLLVLQGDFSLLEDEKRMPLEYWDRLKERGQHTHAFSLPRLRQTYHAGEDFFHLVTGLRHIDLLVDTVLQARDRIGHGLALGLDPEAWLVRNHGRVQVQAGVALDDLVWIRQIGREVGELRAGAADKIEQVAADLCREIYGEAFPMSVLQDAALARRRFPPKKDARDLSPGREIVRRECWDKGVSDRMMSLANRDVVRLLNEQVPLLNAVQKHLCNKVARKGIYIEINPSSNLATGHILRMREHPLHRIFQMSEGRVRLTVNTDDPGVFATRIDQELALVLESLLVEHNNDIPKVMDIMDMIRRRGLESCFGFSRRQSTNF